MSHRSTLFLGPVLCLIFLASNAATGAPVLPPPNDHNGDGKSDILWRNFATGENRIYLMDGASIVSDVEINTVAVPDWNIVGDGDYNGDGNADILWRNTATGANWMYLMNGASIVATVSLNTVFDLNWKIVGDGDYNNDGRADILWRHGMSGQVNYWQMDGATMVSGSTVTVVNDLNWKIAGSGDYDGDGNADILWRHETSGQVNYWQMDGATILSGSTVTVVNDLNWKIAGSGDYDGDGNADILWRHDLSGQVNYWQMDGATILSGSTVTVVNDLNWKVAGSGDYSGDGRSDILWRNFATGRNRIWLMNGASITSNLGVNTLASPFWEVMVGELHGSSGLLQRPGNTTCLAPDRPSTNALIDRQLAFPNLPAFISPLALLQAPGDSSQWYAVEKDGRVVRFENSVGVSTSSTFIDIRGPGGAVDVDSSELETGLLSMAFHPDYGVNNHYVFLSYVVAGRTAGKPHTSVIARFESDDNGLTLNPDTVTELITLDQPIWYHNGGNIAFGPDGYLYIGFGDGGPHHDPDDRAQNTSSLYGAVVRIDVDSASPYAIPTDNVFAGNALCNSGEGISACPEIYAWGFRNPWRWNFDLNSGDLWLGDVGQDNYEEVNIVELGGNYGWRCREGAHDHNTSGVCPAGLIDPVIEYDHSVGYSITGGFVYRGSAIPELEGRYVFADWGPGKIFASQVNGQGGYDYELLLNTIDNAIVSFAEDEFGELLYVLHRFGTVYRIVQAGGSSTNTIPDQLTATGCVQPGNPSLPAAGLIPYETNTTFWSDGAVKDRFYAIPDSLTVDVDIAGDWQFPIGTVLVKNFRLFGSLIETRHFMRHTDGEWAGYTYEWNSDETEATRVIGGKTKEVNGQTWIFPSETQCMACHSGAAGFTLGPEHAQLNKDFLYPGTGITANQLITADVIDVLTDPLSNRPGDLPALARSTAGSYFLDFDSVPTGSYSNQDQASGVTVEGNGASLVLTGNTWRKTNQKFDIRAGTILEFDFESTVEGEVQGIGFDEDDVFENAIRIFKLYGSQNWAFGNTDFNNYTGGDPTHYKIPVGQYYTGSAMSLVFANDDDGGAGSNSRISNVRIISCLDCFYFDTVPTSSYSNQDETGGIAVEADGTSLALTDNTWRKSGQTFNITTDTVLEFDFASIVEGEVHGIGFDESNSHNDAIRIFKLYGTQNWGFGNTDFDNYAGGGLTHYEIPVGQYYTGTGMRLVFANDDDAGVGSDSRFSNVRIANSTLEKSVRSYLHTNCSGCHRPFGPVQSNMDLRFDTMWLAMNACDAVPNHGMLDITDAKIIAPGDSTRSVLINRINRRDAHGMPPLASKLVDTAGVNLLTRWVDSLTVCPQ